jgi:Protein of unknown function (DUF2971)
MVDKRTSFERAQSVPPEASGSPSVVYHYTSVEALLGIIDSHTVWASNARFLNDARELEAALVLLREHRKGLEFRAEERQLAVVDTVLAMFRSEGTRVFVASFSAEPDSLSQWRAYCPANAGYAIGFATDQLAISAGKAGFSLRQCSYDLELQAKIIGDAIEATFAYITEQEAEHNLQPDAVLKQLRLHWEKTLDSKVIPGLLEILHEYTPFFQGQGFLTGALSHVVGLTKDPAFREEKEWRLVTEMHPSISVTRVKFRSGRAMLIPYVPVEIARSPAELPIVEIVIGPTLYPDLAKLAIEEFLISRDLRHVRVRNSAAPYRAS